MSNAKPKVVPTRLVETFNRGEYKMPPEMKLAALRAQHQPKIITVTSSVKPTFTDEK